MESRCQEQFKVFDGKKRFLVKVQMIDDQNLKRKENDQIVRCRITMLASSIKSSKEFGGRESVKFWPFNKRDQVIDVLLRKVEQEKTHILEIQIHSPLGKIIGRLR